MEGLEDKRGIASYQSRVTSQDQVKKKISELKKICLSLQTSGTSHMFNSR